ncbi:hypothetical protein ACM26V_19230 [Salipaludibacillus sp. HK11]|uniref:hypothetical protein n=1 Tax=Salipaludibacillus sp. HK11 TaxID=3394320 RepID=UPI0039FD5F40
MLISRWTIFQFLTASLLIGILAFVENQSGTTTVAAGTPINSRLSIFLFITGILGCFYLMFLFQTLKTNTFFHHSFWKNVPILIMVIGVLSTIAILFTGTLGPLFEWVQQWRFLIYLFVVYFLLLYFVLVLSIVRNYQLDNDLGRKTTHLAFGWSLGVLVIGMFFVSPV